MEGGVTIPAGIEPSTALEMLGAVFAFVLISIKAWGKARYPYASFDNITEQLHV